MLGANLPKTVSERDIAYHVHPVTNLRAHEKNGPFVLESGDGVFVTDANGASYIDGMAGLWCASLGFKEPRLARAAMAQMERLPYESIFAGRSHSPVVDLAEALVARAPGELAKVMFQSSGSEAVDTAVKLVWYYHQAIGKPAKRKIIARRRGYHGTGIASASVTGQEPLHRGFGLPLPGFLHVESQHYYREAFAGESEEAFSARRAQELEALILQEDPNTVGAFFAEPVMGAGGVILPPAHYFEKIQAVLRKYDILLVADEVICGFGRTGRYWGSQTFDLSPDLLVCAKALTAAYFPMSAVLMTEPIYQAVADQSDRLGAFAHGYTMGGHPVGAAVALETLRIYDEDDILGHVAKVGPRLQEGFRALADHPLVGDVRGVGLIAGVEFMADPASKTPFDPSRKVSIRVMDAVRRRGVLLRALGDSLACSPPLIIQEHEIETLLSAVRSGLDEVHADIRRGI